MKEGNGLSKTNMNYPYSQYKALNLVKTNTKENQGMKRHYSMSGKMFTTNKEEEREYSPKNKEIFI